MVYDDYQKIIFTRRGFVIGGIKIIFLAILMVRLSYIQIFDQCRYSTLSDKNRLQIRFVAPERGLIVDRKDRLLGFNDYYYRGILNKDRYKVLEESLEKIASLIKLTNEELSWAKEQAKAGGVLPIIFKENLTWAEVAKLEIYHPEIHGLSIEKGQWRRYIENVSLSHVLGYVGSVTVKDLNEKDDIPPISGLRIGKTGLEKSFEEHLRGVAGIEKIEVNARRHIVRTIAQKESQPGKNLKLTIDLDLQKHVLDIIKEHQSATAVVMNPQTGAIYAMVSHPDFNNNLFVSGIRKKDWKKLINNKDCPLNNKPVSGLYSPGSVFKMVVALAGLDKGVIKPNTTFYCDGHLDIGNHRFHCWSWRYGGHGRMDLMSAMVQSCDVFFYRAALEMGAQSILLMAKLFGFGEKTGIELPGEKSVSLPLLNEENKKKKQTYSKGATINLSIGQGSLLTTLLQLCKMVCAIGNGGRLVTPYVVDADHHPTKDMGIDLNHLSLIQQAMYKVVNEVGATGYRAHFEDDFKFYGKTGTVQVKRLTAQQRKDGSYKNLPYEYRDNAIFVGYGHAPNEQAQLAVAVIIEHGVSGGKVAAPIAKKIIQKAREIILNHPPLPVEEPEEESEPPKEP
jgi:penicillin-binding protein 2